MIGKFFEQTFKKFKVLPKKVVVMKSKEGIIPKDLPIGDEEALAGKKTITKKCLAKPSHIVNHKKFLDEMSG